MFDTARTLEGLIFRPHIHDQLSFDDGFLDPSLLRLDDEFTKIDQLLIRGKFAGCQGSRYSPGKVISIPHLVQY